MLLPLKRMFERYQIERSDSDVAAFYCLMYAGEFVTKLLVAALVAGLREDTDRHRYGLLRSLVRADGIGEWVTALDSVLTGPASQYLSLIHI